MYVLLKKYCVIFINVYDMFIRCVDEEFKELSELI